MTYTVSHRQAGVTRSQVGGLMRHEYRDVDKTNGIETQHSNERIVPSRTHLNESFMWVDGVERPVESSRQIIDELDRRLSKAGGTRTNKKTGETTRVAVRKDAKVVRSLVLQLDPEFTRSSAYLLSDDCSEEHHAEVMRLMDVMVEHYADVYGRENLLAASLHLDETSPHVHLMVTPIDEDGRVRQESFIKAGRGKSSGLSKNDRELRQRLITEGYDADAEPRGMNRSHMSIDEYARHQEQEQQLQVREVEVADREMSLKRREGAVEAREASVRSQEHSAAERLSEADLKLSEAHQVRGRANEAGRRALEKQRAADAERAAYEKGRAASYELTTATEALMSELKEGTRRVSKETLPEIKRRVDHRNEAMRDLNTWFRDEQPTDTGPQLGD